jgi:hypothetical protein
MANTVHRSNRTDDTVALADNRTDRERSLHALHDLELQAGSAAPGREHDWLQDVLRALGSLEAVLATQHENSTGSDSMLSEIQRDEPRLHNRVVQLRRDYNDLRRAVSDLRMQLAIAPPDGLDVVDVRQRLDRLATELRLLRAREADLVYEAYNVDVGAGD